MSIDFTVYSPEPPLHAKVLAERLRARGWEIRLMEPDGGPLAPGSALAGGTDVYGWEVDGADDPTAVAAAVDKGDVEDVLHAIGVCELTVSAFDRAELEDLEDAGDVEPAVMTALRKARTVYGIHAAIGSPASWTADLQDALFAVLGSEDGAVIDIDGELALGIDVGDNEDAIDDDDLWGEEE